MIKILCFKEVHNSAQMSQTNVEILEYLLDRKGMARSGKLTSQYADMAEEVNMDILKT